MKKSSLIIIPLLIIIIGYLSAPLLGENIYKTVSPNGTIRYSDMPSAGAKVISLSESKKTKSQNEVILEKKRNVKSIVPETLKQGSIKVGIQQTLKPNKKPKKDKINYSPIELTYKDPNNNKFVILSGEKVFLNQRLITIKVKLNQDLAEGHTVSLFLNGKQFGQSQTSMQFSLNNLDPNKYFFSAEVKDQDGVILNKSQSITTYVRYVRKKK